MANGFFIRLILWPPNAPRLAWLVFFYSPVKTKESAKAPLAGARMLLRLVGKKEEQSEIGNMVGPLTPVSNTGFWN